MTDAPETETDANGLTDAEREALYAIVRPGHHVDWSEVDPEFADLTTSVERIVAERVRVVEGERDAARAEREDWVRVARRHLGSRDAEAEAGRLALARAESAEAAHADVSADYDSRGERLWRLAVKAGHVPHDSDNDATAELVIADALAAHEAEKAAHERLRAGVEALARDLAARAEGKHDLASETDYEVDIARFNGEGTGLGIAHALATDLLGTPASESPYMNELEHCSSSDDRALLDGSRGPVTGVDLIRAERQRQIDIEGYSAEHDEHHGGFALSQAAYCYKAYGLLPRGAVPDLWPWDRESWKPRDPARNLIRSGALYLAAAEQGYPGSREAADRCALLLDEAAASLLRGGEAR